MITRVACVVTPLVLLLRIMCNQTNPKDDRFKIDRGDRRLRLTLSIEIAFYRLQYPAIFRAIRTVTGIASP